MTGRLASSVVCFIGLAVALAATTTTTGCTTRLGAGAPQSGGGGGIGGVRGRRDGGIGQAGAADGSPARDGSVDAPQIACTFTVVPQLSSKIPTVGIVTFSTRLATVTEAHIDFGLDTAYGLTAPVDLRQPAFRTLLLGMKASRTYHFRIAVTTPDGVCRSPDTTLTTGPVPSGLLPALEVTTSDRARLAGGFLITTQTASGGSASSGSASSGLVSIIDADGDYVWWYAGGLSRTVGARMTGDGSAIWLNSANAPEGAAQVRRVTMDGATDTDFSTAFAGAHNQMTPLPDGSVAFCARNLATDCDDLNLFPASGTTNSGVTRIVDTTAAHGGTGPCGCSGLAYSADDDTLVFADLASDCVTKVTRTGQTVWVLNGGTNGTLNSFTGDDWAGGVHGLDVLSTNDILLFANNSATAGGVGGTGNGSVAMELRLDTTTNRATRVWSYMAMPGIQVDSLGDVRRLPNGNTIVGYSTKGELQEVTASGAVVQDIKWPAGAAFGYVEKRPTLYGKSIR